jgi:hypothetical protein
MKEQYFFLLIIKNIRKNKRTFENQFFRDFFIRLLISYIFFEKNINLMIPLKEYILSSESSFSFSAATDN